MSNIVYETGKPRYMTEVERDGTWEFCVGTNHKESAIAYADHWTEVLGMQYRVVDTQAKRGADENVIITQARHVELSTGETFDLDTGEITEPVSDPDTSPEPGVYGLDEYQEATGKTAIYDATTTEDALEYLVPALTAEAGEVAGKWAKWKRDRNTEWIPDELTEALILELGDVLWMVARIAGDLGVNLNKVAVLNIEKLLSRQTRGTLGGSGDDR